MDCSLLVGLEHRSFPAARIFQRRELLVGDALPLRRSGMCARSISATIENRRPQIRKFLGSRRQLTLAPDLLLKLHEALQDFRLIRQHLAEVDYLADSLVYLVT